MGTELTLGQIVDSKIGQEVFASWLQSDQRHAAEIREAAYMPQELLNRMVHSPISVDDSGQAVTVLEALLLQYINIALSGNLSAMNKIYDELQHQGIKKVAVAHGQLNPVARAVLERAGVLRDETPVTEGEFFGN